MEKKCDTQTHTDTQTDTHRHRHTDGGVYRVAPQLKNKARLRVAWWQVFYLLLVKEDARAEDDKL